MPPRISADDFMSKPPRPRRGRPSSLAPFAADLTKMRDKGYALAEQKEFLALNGVEVGVSTISMFFSRQKAKASDSVAQVSAG
jgi:hypothetical protein